MPKFSTVDDPREAALELVPGRVGPNITELAGEFYRALSSLEGYVSQLDENSDTRRCLWAGQSPDNRKHASSGVTPQPWEGAADNKVYYADEMIDTHVSLLMTALRRANLTAFPVEGNDIERATLITNVMKWMVNSNIKEFYDEMELAYNHFFQDAIACVGIFYDKRMEQTTQRLEIQQFPEQTQMDIMDGLDDDQLAEDMRQSVPDLKQSDAVKMIASLRHTGSANVPFTRKMVDRPIIRTFQVGRDIFFPLHTTDIQKAPWIFQVEYLSPQELRCKVYDEDWDSGWVEYLIANLKGQSDTFLGTTQTVDQQFLSSRELLEKDGLVKIVHVYQRLTSETGVPGIYLTTMHPDFTDASVANGVKQPYAKSSLLGYQHGEYPFKVKRLKALSKNLYDVRGYAQTGKALQDQLKVELDASADASSLSTLPPLMHPYGREPTEWGPFVFQAYWQDPREYQFADIPNQGTHTVDVRNEIRTQGDRYFGRMSNNTRDSQQEIQIKQQALIDKGLSFAVDILDHAFTLFQQFGPELVKFSVFGVPDPQVYEQGDPSERFDFYFNYNQLEADPAHVEKIIQGFTHLKQLDDSGTMDTASLLQVAGEKLDPVIARRIFIPAEQAQEKEVKREREALAQIAAGMDVNIDTDAASEVAIQVIQQYLQGSEDIPATDVQERMQNDEPFRQRIEKRMQMHQHQIEQRTTNPQAGVLGGRPSNMGGQ